MAKPLSFLRAATPAAAICWAMFGAPAPAAAQYLIPWGGGWVERPPALVGPGEDMFDDDDMISARIVRRILRERGYRLVGDPVISGDNIVAIGENRRGRRMRFVIDGYSGGVMRASILRGSRAPSAEARHDWRYDRDAEPGDGFVEGRPLAEPDLDRAAKTHHKAKPKHRAARREQDRHKTRKEAPAPSQATKAPEPPTPAAAAAKPTEPETKKETAAVPEATPKPAPETPAPSQATKAPPSPEPAEPATPSRATAAPESAGSPAQAAKPAAKEATATPAADVKTPLAPDAQPQAKPEPGREAKPQSRPVETATPAKPTDIGPQVIPISPKTRAEETPVGAPKATRTPEAANAPEAAKQ